MRRKIHKYLSTAVLILTVGLTSFAQKAKPPSDIGDGFVLAFNPPFERILIDTSEKGMPNRLSSEILVTADTKIRNHKGIPIAREAIRAGMKIEIKLESNNP